MVMSLENLKIYSITASIWYQHNSKWLHHYWNIKMFSQIITFHIGNSSIVRVGAIIFVGIKN